MVSSAVVSSNAKVSLAGERVVVSGGTTGIGAAVAVRFAQAGADVWIVGRSAERAESVLAQARAVAAQGDHRFFQADLSSKAEIARVADELKTAAGERGIDRLIMTQGGPANSALTDENDVFDKHFAVQTYSRFALGYKLAIASPIVKKSVMAIAVAGQGGASFDADDIPLLKLKQTRKYGMLSAAVRDCTVLDASFIEFQKHRPEVQFTHLFPGLVDTDVMKSNDMGTALVYTFKIISALAGHKPAQYADIPFYFAANPEGVGRVEKEGQWWNERLKPLQPSPPAQKEDVRKKIWEYMLGSLE